MTQRVVVVRPEPGNAATAAHARSLGFDVLAQPLFAVRALPWTAPDPASVDALLVTSANAIRHGGATLAGLRDRPVVAVGEATTRAAVAAGFTVVATGTADAAAAVALATSRGFTRLFHPAGRDRIAVPGVASASVYASGATPIPPGATAAWRGATVLLHSPRAARRVADLVARDATDRATIALAALSPAVATAAGTGWRTVGVALHPTDAALLALVAPTTAAD